MKIYLKASYAILIALFIVLVALGVYYVASSGLLGLRTEKVSFLETQLATKFRGVVCSEPKISLITKSRGGEQGLYEIVCPDNSAVNFDQYLRNLKERYSDWTVFNEYRNQLILRQTANASSSFTINFQELRIGLNSTTMKIYVLDAQVTDNRLASEYYRLLSVFNRLLLP